MRRFAAAVVVLVPSAALWFFGAPLFAQGLLTLGFPGAAARLFDDPAQKAVALYRAERWSDAAEAFGSGPANAYNRGNALARGGRYAEAVKAYEQALAADPDDEDAAYNEALVTTLIDNEQPVAGANSISANSAASRARDTHDASNPDGETGGSGDGFAGSREGASSLGAQGSSKAGKFGKGEQASPDAGQGEAKGSAGDSGGTGRTGAPQVDIARTMRDRDRRIQRRMEARSVQPTEEWLSSLADDPGRFLKLRIIAEQARRKAQSASARDEDDP